MNSEAIKTMLNIDLMVWNELACLLEKHPEENLHAKGRCRGRPVMFTPTWPAGLTVTTPTSKLIATEKNYRSFSKTPEEMNDIWQKEDCCMSLDQARTKAGVALASRIAVIEAVPLEKWDAEMYRLVSYDGASHYAKHIDYIVRV